MKAGTAVRDRAPLLLDPSQALTHYLDSLFRDVPVAAAGDGAGDTPRLEPAAAEPAVVPPAAPPAAEVLVETAPIQSAFDRTPFNSLIIRIGRLRLAIPLTRLHGIRPLPEKLTRLPGSPAWSMGTLAGRDGNVQVVDPAPLLGVHDEAGPRPDGPRHAVIIAEQRWALCCDAVEKVIRIEPALVRWSGGCARQLWLAGIVPGELCTLLHAPAFVEHLERGAPEPE